MDKINKCPYCGEEITDEDEIYEYDPQDFGPIQYWHRTCAEAAGIDKEEDTNNVGLTFDSGKDISENKVESALSIIGWLTIAAGIIVGIISMNKVGIIGLGIMIPSVIGGVILLGFAENIKLLEQIKEKISGDSVEN